MRQLQWWDERGLLSPAQEGHKRQYGARELFQVALFCDLRAREFSLQAIARISKQIERKGGFEFSGSRPCWMLTDGKRVELLEHAEPVLAFLEERRPKAFRLLSLSGLADRLAQRVALAPATLRPLVKRGPGTAHSVTAFSPFAAYLAREAKQA